MKRFHLLELEDQPWWPRVFRDATTDYLNFVARLFHPYRPAVPRLTAALRQCGTVEILDLCSGAGGSWPTLLPALRANGIDVSVCLTDRFPNVAALERIAGQIPGVRFEAGSVNAVDVPARLGGFRTLFAGFHHFRPTDARAVLASAVRDGSGIAIFEFTANRLSALALMLLTPLMVCLLTPWIRPFRCSRLFWTYLVPVVPAAVLFDGIVSCLRTYTPGELLILAAQVRSDGYEWSAGTDYTANWPMPITYLIGVPASDASKRT